MSTRLDIPITKPDRLVHALVGVAAALKWLISDPHGPSKRPTAAGRLTGRPSTAPAAPEANMIVLHYRAIPDLRRQVRQALAALRSRHGSHHPPAGSARRRPHVPALDGRPNRSHRVRRMGADLRAERSAIHPVPSCPGARPAIRPAAHAPAKAGP